MNVRVENQRRENKPSLERHGWKWDFKVDNAPPNTKIYQTVFVDISSSDGDSDKYSFTESWPYKHNRKVTDSFLVPLDWRVDVKGRLKVTAFVWAKPGPLPAHFRKGTSADHWGNLFGSYQLLNPPDNATGRKIRIAWDNRGVTRGEDYQRGKDLILAQNLIS